MKRKKFENKKKEKKIKNHKSSKIVSKFSGHRKSKDFQVFSGRFLLKSEKAVKIRDFLVLFPKGKRAFIASAIVDLWSYVLFVFIILIFFMLFSLKSCTQRGPLEQTITKDTLIDTQLDMEFLNYLRTPTNISEFKTNADLLVYLYKNKKFKKTYNEQIKKDLQNIYSQKIKNKKIEVHQIIISSGSDKLIIGDENEKRIEIGCSSTFFIPIENAQYIEVKICLSYKGAY